MCNSPYTSEHSSDYNISSAIQLLSTALHAFGLFLYLDPPKAQPVARNAKKWRILRTSWCLLVGYITCTYFVMKVCAFSVGSTFWVFHYAALIQLRCIQKLWFHFITTSHSNSVTKVHCLVWTASSIACCWKTLTLCHQNYQLLNKLFTFYLKKS